MATVKFGKAPAGFRLMPEGPRVLHVESVSGVPRTKVSKVEVKFRDKDGIPLINKYDLNNDGGYAAFYFLVKNGLGIDLNEGDAFDLDDLVGEYIEVEIVHKEGSRPREDGTVATFANIKATLGPGKPFALNDDASVSPDEDDDDED